MAANALDMSDIKGQHHARRALEIAAAGNHPILFIGAPGSAKTMLARRLISILPPMTEQERAEVAEHFLTMRLIENAAQITQRPFRAPHHTISDVGLRGSRSFKAPHLGEITLAHHGVLFVDELPEFRKATLDAITEAIRSGSEHKDAEPQFFTHKAAPLLVGASNACPCGYADSRRRACQCKPHQPARYLARIRPVLELFDLVVRVSEEPAHVVTSAEHQPESSATIQARATAARKRLHDISNARAASPEVNDEARAIMRRFIETTKPKPQQTQRVYHVARTVAALANAPEITAAHIAEGIAFANCLNLDPPQET